MLSKEQAERLADAVLATERVKHPPRRRIVWCMWLWRLLSPELRRLAPDAERDLAYDAVAEANSQWLFKALGVLVPVAVVVAHVPLALGLATCMVIPAAHTWLAWRGIERRLPEALAACVEVGQV